MIDLDSPSPSSDQSSAPDRERPDCPAIVTASMPVAPQSVLQIDEAQWTDIVLSSLPTRSREAKEALLQALLNDQPARSTGSSNSMGKDWGNGEREVSEHAARNDQTQASITSSKARPVSGTILPKTPDFQHSDKLCRTTVSHSVGSKAGLNPRFDVGGDDTKCRTGV